MYSCFRCINNRCRLPLIFDTIAVFKVPQTSAMQSYESQMTAYVQVSRNEDGWLAVAFLAKSDGKLVLVCKGMQLLPMTTSALSNVRADIDV